MAPPAVALAHHRPPFRPGSVRPKRRYPGPVKVLLAVLLVLLLLVVALPMGMGDMGDCPACTSAETFALGLCAGILSLIVLGLSLTNTSLRRASEARYRFLQTRTIYRPPRFI